MLPAHKICVRTIIATLSTVVFGLTLTMMPVEDISDLYVRAGLPAAGRFAFDDR